MFETRVTEIGDTWVDVVTCGEPARVAADRVLALTGYRPDFEFLRHVGIDLVGEARAPLFDVETMETNRPGVYVAGTVCGGEATSRWFIENGRVHAVMIAAHAAGLPAPHLEVKPQP
jgi:thioredoxin reductase (NADPH)